MSCPGHSFTAVTTVSNPRNRITRHNELSFPSVEGDNRYLINTGLIYPQLQGSSGTKQQFTEVSHCVRGISKSVSSSMFLMDSLRGFANHPLISCGTLKQSNTENIPGLLFQTVVHIYICIYIHKCFKKNNYFFFRRPLDGMLRPSQKLVQQSSTASLLRV